MRSSLLLVLLIGCAKPDQIKQCYPVASWQPPTFNCEGAAPPPPPAPEPVKEEPPPAPEPPKAEVKDDKIDLKEKVQFEFAKAELLPQSKTLLDEVVKIMKDHPEIEKIRIEGHTDSDASDGYNLKLSNNRAASVKAYLVSKGIDGNRMESKGFGESKPIADNKTDDGKEQNRRVEIYIVKRKDK
jgi:outer membrane protein OmpA-like peptidoglycan-associated protein